MPYDPTVRAFTGEAAHNVQGVALEVLVNWLFDQLNQAGAPALEWEGSALPVAVTPTATLADAITKSDKRTPVVFVARGRRERDAWGREIDGQFYPGQRVELSFPLDMATNIEEIEDVTLCDAVCAAIEGREVELWELGLTEIEITGDEEAQDAGAGRNPYLITCAAYTLPTYRPVGAPLRPAPTYPNP